MQGDLLIAQDHDFTLVTRDSSVGHWRFRGDLTDSAGDHTLTGVNIGDSNYGIGFTESDTTALHLTGSNYATLPTAQGADFSFTTQSFTIEAIVKATAVTAVFHVKKADPSATVGYLLSTNSGHVYCRIGDGSNQANLSSISTIQAGVWYHLCMVVDRENDEMRVYINGEEETNSPKDISAVTGSLSNPYDVVIGEGLEGALDEICISTEVLTEKAIAERAAGRMRYAHDYDSDFPMRYVPQVHHGNDALDQFMIPFSSLLGTLKSKAGMVEDLLKWDESPERFLSHLDSYLGFELLDAAFATEQERRNFLKWVIWIYQRKGTALGVQKIIELLGFNPEPIEEHFPDTFPLVLTHHLTWDRDHTTTPLIYDDFSSNLAAWDQPLNTTSTWTLYPDYGYLLGKGNGSDDPSNGILTNDGATELYAEIEYEAVANGHEGFGIYLRYQDEDNWILFQAVGFGIYIIGQIVWKNGGSEQYQNIGILPDLDDQIHKLWVYADFDGKTFTAGVDDTTCLYNYTVNVPELDVVKVGLFVNESAEVRFHSFTISEIDRSKAGVLWKTDHGYRGYSITLDGEPANFEAKERYLIRIINNYVPFGSHLRYTIEPSPVQFALGSNGATVKVARIVAFGLGSNGAVPVMGTLTITPDAVGFAFGTKRYETPSAPTAFALGQGGVICTADIDYGLFNQDDTTPTSGTGFEMPESDYEEGEDMLQDGMFSGLHSATVGTSAGQDLDDWSVGFKLTQSETIVSITVYDCKADDDPWDGYHPDSDDWRLYKSTNGTTYTQVEDFTSLTRDNGVTTVTLTTPTEGLYWKLHCYNGKLLSPTGAKKLHPIEIKALQLIEPS